MQYKFYVQMDGETFGPYSAREVRDLQLMDDILVTEESMNEWLPACRFDFDDMVRKELGSYINEDGTINRPEFVAPVTEPETIDSGHTSDVPEAIKGWNWGAFFFNWLWGVFNGIYWPLILIVLNFIPYVGPIIAFCCCIALGIKGNEWAWKAKAWSGIAEFKRVQHNWAIAILWIFGISFIIGLIIGFSS